MILTIIEAITKFVCPWCRREERPEPVYMGDGHPGNVTMAAAKIYLQGKMAGAK